MGFRWDSCCVVVVLDNGFCVGGSHMLCVRGLCGGYIRSCYMVVVLGLFLGGQMDIYFDTDNSRGGIPPPPHTN